MPRLNLNTDHIVEAYGSGLSMNRLAEVHGCSVTAIRNCLNREGIAIRPKPDPDAATVAELYLSGLSENQIAQRLGVNRGTIRKRLIKAGIAPRTQSEAEALKWSQMTAEQRSRQVAAANEAARGRVRSEQELINRAQLVYDRQLRISDNEQWVAQMLRAHGLAVEQQFPVHTCNIDIAVQPGPIAVEVHGGGWHSTEHHRRLMAEKAEQLFSRGWALIEIWMDHRFCCYRTTDELIALIDELGRLPSVAGEHWVVLGNRKHPTRLRADSDHWACVAAAHPSSEDPAFNLGVA